MTAQRGWFRMACWNGLSDAQQTRLIEDGNLPIGYEPEGSECHNGATIAVETAFDKAPGPRFYCVPCALKYLQEEMPHRIYWPELTDQQIGILNSLVTFAAEHVPGGLSDDEREVARIVGKVALS